MRNKFYKFNKIKKKKTDNEEEIILVDKKYDRETGEATEEEKFLDPKVLPDRVKALQEEINEIEDLQTKIKNDEIDEVEDNRSKKYG